MKKPTLSLILLSIPVIVSAQNFEVPANYKFEKAEDYSKYESLVLQAIDWINETPIRQEQEKRKETNAFLLQWLSGSPSVHLEIKEQIVTFLNSPDLLMVFMGGWTKYSLESKDFNNKVASSLAGIEAVIAFYTKNRPELKKDKNVEKYVKMKESGTLQRYIEENA